MNKIVKKRNKKPPTRHINEFMVKNYRGTYDEVGRCEQCGSAIECGDRFVDFVECEKCLWMAYIRHD